MNTLVDNGCPDGSFCTAQGTCIAPAVCGADADCTDDDPCTQMEHCDVASATCAWQLLDNDGDGYVPAACGGDDPDDAVATTYPGSPEICDGHDNDMDGDVDEADAVAIDCAGRGGGSCDDGVCVVCTAADFDWLTALEQGHQRWVTRMANCAADDPTPTCYETTLEPLSDACQGCFAAYYQETSGCADSACRCLSFAADLAMLHLGECAVSLPDSLRCTY